MTVKAKSRIQAGERIEEMSIYNAPARWGVDQIEMLL